MSKIHKYYRKCILPFVVYYNIEGRNLLKLLATTFCFNTTKNIPGIIGSWIRKGVYSPFLKKIHSSAILKEGITIQGPYKLEIGKNVIIEQQVLLNAISRDGLSVGENTRICYGAHIHTWYGEGISIGKNCFIGPYTQLYGHAKLIIEDGVLIAGQCFIVPGTHDIETPGPIYKNKSPPFKGIRIKTGAWLGANVKVLDGVEIGENAVIGAGAVVTENIPDNAVAVGVPAKVIKYRKTIS